MHIEQNIESRATNVVTTGETSRRLPALLAALFGLGLVFVAGFAETQVVHNVAHDTRHSAGFPCH